MARYNPSVPDLLGRGLGVSVVWTVAGLALGWGHLAASWRRGLALLTSVAGLVCLSVALNTEGLRESPTTAAFLVGPSYVTGHASASASLPYYVLTGACLFLGTVGLAATDRLLDARRHAVRSAIFLSIFVTIVRFALENAAAPPAITGLFGVVWLAPVVGAFVFLALPAAERTLSRMVRLLLVYALWVRGFVALTYYIASTFRLGSHYDVSGVVRLKTMLAGRTYHFVAGTFSQVLILGVLPQILFWPIYTVILGLMGAAVAWVVTSSSRPRVRPRPLGAPVEMAHARQDP
jgi:hypothetical protein